MKITFVTDAPPPPAPEEWAPEGKELSTIHEGSPLAETLANSADAPRAYRYFSRRRGHSLESVFEEVPEEEGSEENPATEAYERCCV